MENHTSESNQAQNSHSDHSNGNVMNQVDIAGIMMQVQPPQNTADPPAPPSSPPSSFYQSRLSANTFDKHTCQRCQKAFAARSSLLRHARKCPMLHFHPYAAPTSSSSTSAPPQQLFSVFHSSVGSQPVRVESAVPQVTLPYPPPPTFTVPAQSRDTLDEDERIISVPSSEAETLEVVFGEVDGYCIGRKKLPPPNTPLPIIITDMVCFLLRTRNRGGFMPTNSTWRHPIAALLLTLGLSREDLDNTLGLNYKNRKTPSLEHSVLQVQQKNPPQNSPPARSSQSSRNASESGNGSGSS